MDHQLVGILGLNTPSQDEGGDESAVSGYWAIPAHVIARLIEKYCSDSADGKPQPEAADSAFESIHQLEMELKSLLETYARQHPKVQETETRLKALQAVEDRIGKTSSTNAAATSLILRSAEEFECRLNEVEAELQRVVNLEDRGYASAAAVESSRRQLAIIRWEYATQIRVLELELKEAQTARETAFRVLTQARALSESERIEKHGEGRTARLRAERAKTLLELYRKVGPTEPPPLEPVDEEARADGTEVEDPAELIWDVLGVKLRPLSRDELPNNRYRGGMQVTEIRKGSPAVEAKLRVDDIIAGLHHWETTSVENVVFVLNHPDLQPKPDRPFDVRVLVLRDGEMLFTTLSQQEMKSAAVR